MYPEIINACINFINKLKNDFKGITFQYYKKYKIRRDKLLQTTLHKKD